MGEQCQRALGVLRTAGTLRHLRLTLGAPTERLLGVALGAVRHAPRLERLDLTIDHRMRVLGPGHLAALEGLAGLPEVSVTVVNARVDVEVCRARLARAFGPSAVVVCADDAARGLTDGAPVPQQTQR